MTNLLLASRNLITLLLVLSKIRTSYSFATRLLRSSRTMSSNNSNGSCLAGAAAAAAAAAATTEEATGNNPLLDSWTHQPFLFPPFSKIETQHFKTALDVGMNLHLDDLEEIVENEDEPTFANVMEKLDQAGGTLGRVQSVFGNMCSSKNTKDLQEVQREMTPILSRHRSATYSFKGLYPKIDALYQKRNELNLNTEQLRLVERIHLDFKRSGAHFDEEKQQRQADIAAEMASLSTEFMQNVMQEEENYELVLKLDDLKGCPDSLIEAAQTAAKDRNKADDDYVITLSRSLVEPFLTYASRRDLRQTAFEAWTNRGEASGNLKLASKMLQLRQELAQLHDYQNFAQYQCADRMAQTPENVMKLLNNVWSKAKVAADRERQALEDFVKQDGQELENGIQPWDWRYYAEKVRIAHYDLDESQLKPYLSLKCVTEAVMGVSNKLYGLQYIPRPDLDRYHEDVETYEVRNANDKLVALFVHDNYARPFKSGGAWMSEYRSQTKNLADGMDPMEGIPIISNNNNFAKGTNTLLSFDDATTLFHEMGHAHHGMLSDCTYSRLSSTNVLSDWVELPSQLMEHWLGEQDVLKQYARHFETNEPVPDELIQKLKAAQAFNQGFDTIEYTACALIDMMIHSIDNYNDDFDVSKFEREALEQLGMPQGIVMRHRPAHFLHLFASTSYAAGYYVYQWAEVLDADVFAAFKEAGDIFDADTAEKVRKYIYSSGNTEAPEKLFQQFRGREPAIEYMLEKKGLARS